MAQRSRRRNKNRFTGEPNGLQPGDDVGNRRPKKVVQVVPDDIGNRKTVIIYIGAASRMPENARVISFCHCIVRSLDANRLGYIPI